STGVLKTYIWVMSCIISLWLNSCVVWKTVVKVINSYTSHLNNDTVAAKERSSFIMLIDQMKQEDASNLTDLGVMRWMFRQGALEMVNL
ncbi:MAG: hypothetical protein ACXV8J_11030, partial [Methylobacter sp.]